MKVLVIVTGGTIGSTWSNGTIGLEKQSELPLLSLYWEKMESFGIPDVEFIMTSPYQLLSENSTGKVLGRLAESIYAGLEQAEQEGCRGIIVTHGTDTLAYSAAMAGYLFMNCPVPVVFVSANYVLSDTRSNGLDNFHYALELIRNHTGGGVYVSYRNTGDVPRIHLGTRVLGHQPFSDDVYSVGGACAWFDEDGIHNSFDWRREQPVGGNGQTEQGLETVEKQVWLGAAEQWENGEDVNGSRKMKDRSRSAVRWRDLQWDAPILQIHPAPGMGYPAIPPETKAVLHHTYHAGTICSATPGIDLFFEEAGRRQIPVFLTGADPELVYDSTRKFARYGIHVLPKASPVSMYMKLWLLLVSGRDPVEWMGREMAGEFPLGKRGK
ncbi:MAG: asparaginase domain-containing protein [Lachnospiraceae bacterium]|nr:asparaginase domain-containing protein [Lachnospiraceae bacterium]